jgi:SPFH domain / Band 7 family
MGCCVSISQSTIGVKEKWGRYDGMLHPGLHFLIPCCGDSIVARVNLRTQQLSIRVESISADKVSVTIGGRSLPSFTLCLSVSLSLTHFYMLCIIECVFECVFDFVYVGVCVLACTLLTIGV